MLFNLRTGDYDADLLSLFNIPESLLPKVCDSSGIVAHTDASVIGQRIPIAGIIGDQQAALFAQCGDDTSKLKNTYGTGLFVVANTGSTPLEIDGLVTTVAWRQNGVITYALEGSIFIGGSAIQWLRDGLQLFTNASETEAMATALEDNEGVYFVPALVGLGAPHWDSDARGLFTGLTRGTTRNHMVRAALEALAYQTADVINTISEHLPITTLRVDGGAVHNTFLMQFQSDILNMPVEKPNITESTAYGAAKMADLATQLWTRAHNSDSIDIETSFSPKMPDETRERNLQGWKAALQRTLLKPLP
jgi:glycerol kinase